MENYIGATSGSPLQGQMHIVRLGDDPLKTLYIRQGTPIEKNYDLKFYDCGKFEIATIGMNVVVDEPLNCGEIWVSYEIELLKPRLRASVSKVDHYTGSFWKTGAWSQQFPMGDRGYSVDMIPTSTEGSLGTWRLGTRIGVGAWSPGIPCQTLVFNQGLANRFFRIEYMVQMKGPGQTLCAVDDKVLNIEFTCPDTLGTIEQGVNFNAGSFPLFKAVENIGIGSTHNTGATYYASIFIKTNGMTSNNSVDGAESLKFRFSTPETATYAGPKTDPAVNVDYCWDLIVTELNQADFAKNF